MIYVVIGRSRFIGNLYEPIMKPIKGYLDENNISYITIEFADQVKRDKKNIYIGIFNHVSQENMPTNYIMYVIDPLENSDQDLILKAKKASKILVYLKNLSVLNPKSIFFPFPYHRNLENIYSIEKFSLKKKYDILMIGSLNKKRLDTYYKLKNANYNIYCPNVSDFKRGIFETEHDKLLYSAKIVLLQNYYDNDDSPRTVYNAANKIFFIYVLNKNENENLLKESYNNLIVKTKIDDIEKTIDFYLEHEEKRKETVDKLYEYVTTKHRVDFYLNKEIFYC